MTENGSPEGNYLVVIERDETGSHHFMANLAADLGKRGIATLRYQFPYMEKRGRRKQRLVADNPGISGA